MTPEEVEEDRIVIQDAAVVEAKEANPMARKDHQMAIVMEEGQAVADLAEVKDQVEADPVEEKNPTVDQEDQDPEQENKTKMPAKICRHFLFYYNIVFIQ